VAFPTTPTLDLFTGTNENPLVTNWEGPLFAGDNRLQREGGVMWGTDGWCSGYYDVNTSFGPDMEIWGHFGGVLGGNGIELALRCINLNTANVRGYMLHTSFTAGSWGIYRLSDGYTQTQLGASFGPSCVFSDSMGFEAIGSTLNAYHKTSAGAWTLIASRTDATWNHAGALGVIVNENGFGFTEFGGGTISGGTVAVGRDLSLPWTIRRAAGRNMVLPWTIRDAAGNNLVLPWTLRRAAGSSIVLPWTIRRAAGRDLGLSWTVRTPTGRDLTLQWTIEGANVAVDTAGQNLELPWTVRRTAGRDLTTLWTIRERAGRDLELPYTIRATVGSEIELPWAIRRRVGRDLDIRWSILTDAIPAPDMELPLEVVITVREASVDIIPILMDAVVDGNLRDVTLVPLTNDVEI
jgi:hypothetical protein